ncbi:programmed cell death protein 2-like [Mixophyes fleayi]|uniref:programmed cell death protein 2-like n=1 Tax=Mixophyes fleayi TaxID=3061075 RepID=UPI003F4D8F6E
MAQAPSQEQRVLLGFKDAILGDTGSSWDTSKIGGLPDSPPYFTILFPSCPLCSAVLCHVVQVYCPLEGSQYHRVIHVFACGKKSCWGKPESWVALRSQSLVGYKSKITQTLSQQDKTSAADWCEDADNWGSDDDEPYTTPSVTLITSDPSVPLQTDWRSQLQSLSLTDTSEPVQSCHPVFQSYYMAVAEEEDCECDTDLDHARRLLREYEQREETLMEDLESFEGKGEGEKYEKSDLQNRNSVFYKFLKKISPCQQQILRYSWNGTPLYMSPPDVASQPLPCTRCGGKRVFEFQLMPALVSMLHGTEADLMLEFGTVLIFTCERSCWEARDNEPVREFCIVQEDPDQKYFK